MSNTSNRLDLDFSIDDFQGRNEFLHNYLERPEFKKRPPTNDELEMCANYLLWGKDENGKNAVQRKEIQIETKNKTWTASKEESLEALLESPTFHENCLLGNRAPTKITREVFSREKALRDAPDYFKEEFVKLFAAIDELDLLLNFYDLEHGKRDKPPRSELLERFSEKEIAALKEEASTLKQYNYLKLKHQLVELRREQFVLKDSYTQLHVCDNTQTPPPENFTIDFDAEIQIFPVGAKTDLPVRRLVFLEESKLIPTNFTKEEIEQITHYYWQCKDTEREVMGDRNLFYFDFRNEEHVYQLLLLLEDIEDAALDERYDCYTGTLIDTLNFYADMADFDEVQEEIFNFKIHKVKNTDIAATINKKYGKSYSANYISTIFKQKIVVKICEAAKYHERLLESLSIPEEFKRCNTCGRLLLLDSKNFVKKTRSKDGYVSRCKDCDKEERRLKKESCNK